MSNTSIYTFSNEESKLKSVIERLINQDNNLNENINKFLEKL